MRKPYSPRFESMWTIGANSTIRQRYHGATADRDFLVFMIYPIALATHVNSVDVVGVGLMSLFTKLFVNTRQGVAHCSTPGSSSTIRSNRTPFPWRQRLSYSSPPRQHPALVMLLSLTPLSHPKYRTHRSKVIVAEESEPNPNPR